MKMLSRLVSEQVPSTGALNAAVVPAHADWLLASHCSAFGLLNPSMPTSHEIARPVCVGCLATDSGKYHIQSDIILTIYTLTRKRKETKQNLEPLRFGQMSSSCRVGCLGVDAVAPFGPGHVRKRRSFAVFVHGLIYSGLMHLPHHLLNLPLIPLHSHLIIHR